MSSVLIKLVLCQNGHTKQLNISYTYPDSVADYLMKLAHLFESHPIMLMEVKARIEHPEDLIWDTGSAGVRQALQILDTSAKQPEQVSIKWDGSPALIAGWLDGEFMLTDKAGFSAKGYNGLTTSAQALRDMIRNRKIKLDTPEAQQARINYANKISSLYPLLKQVIPSHVQGFVQGDLLWTHTPAQKDGNFVFQPNKIEYKVPVDSELGAQIGHSKVGIVFHSKLASTQDEEPDALRDPSELGIHSTTDVVVMPHEMQFSKPFKLNTTIKKKIEQLVRTHGAQIDDFLNPRQLSELQIKSLPSVMKSFLAHKAGEGDADLSDASADFLKYLQMPKSKVSPKAQQNILAWIKSHVQAFNAIWQIVALIQKLKLDLKAQMDTGVGDKVQAHLASQPGHEGFVSVTDTGTIKLVNRAQFMKKSDPLTEADTDTTDTPHRVVFTFGRMNPPTLGHKKVVQKVAQVAGNDDYWIFLSHSQDAKKNPLDWHTKLKFASQMMPAHKSHLASGVQFEKIKTPLLAMDWLYDQGYRDITMVVGSDRVQAMTDILSGWNSDEIRGKYNRDPVQIKVVSAGERDPDAEGVEGVSASMVRSLAQKGDFNQFKAAVGLDDALAKQLYHAVRMGMKLKNISESVPDHGSGTIIMLEMSQPHARKLANWCEAHDIPCMDPTQLHMTVIYSNTPAPEMHSLDHAPTQVTAHCVGWRLLGTNALALILRSSAAQQLHNKLRNLGVSHSYPDLLPHTSVNYEQHTTQMLPEAVPDFDLEFDTIRVKPIDPNYSTTSR